MLITSHAMWSVYLNPCGFISRRRLAKSGEKHLEVFYILFCFPSVSYIRAERTQFLKLA